MAGSCLYDKPRRKPTFCMLIEDMMPASAYTRVGSCNEVERLHAAVATLAKLHARWWNHPKQPPLDWLLHPTQDFGGLLLNGFLRVTKVARPSLSPCLFLNLTDRVSSSSLTCSPLLSASLRFYLTFSPLLSASSGWPLRARQVLPRLVRADRHVAAHPQAPPQVYPQ